jgi:hypothetical protein
MLEHNLYKNDTKNKKEDVKIARLMVDREYCFILT